MGGSKKEAIYIQNLGKTYISGGREICAIGDFSLTVYEGEFVSIVGPSGCGKSTVLNIIASFLAPTRGTAKVGGKDVIPGVIPAHLGYIFQKDTVLPWFTVAANIALGLRFRDLPRDEIADKVRDLLEVANLRGCESLYPYQLSGGMRQRVALLMTLACDPRVLLLDEPFGALDTHTKIVLHKELLEIWRRLGQTIILVTHDLDEAISLSDRVIVMSAPPSKLILDHAVTIPHPRDVFSIREEEVFAVHAKEVWHVLGREFRDTKVSELELP
jgi:NitT/TauT family transport system ATP-binding protein